MDASGNIRVAVRVRPLLPSDGATDLSLLQLNTGRPNEVVLASDNDRRTARRYTFDRVFGPDVTQDELYGRVGVKEMVAAAVEGYHSTIFAYGQTGSGKTYTMEGYRYMSPSHASAKTAVGSAGGRGGAARAASGMTAAATPQADFTATPDEQLGLTPRAVRELFAAVARDRSRRFQIRCSFVQIYREQVYDLLNPATLSGLPGSGGGGPRRPGGGGSAGGPLRMRWSQQEGFYLDNLFTPEVDSADEAIVTFQAGVANKVMSSHRLNAASSRSHCIFALHLTSSPLESPLEQRTAKLTLVDLAGSERAAHTGATTGVLRDESVAINKSLFTLRQVITALTDSAAAASAAAPPPHVPYRDSKLTCLLKHSLGGSSLTLMVACLSPADIFFEENASTLDYAARARRITNHVAVNEDPRSRLIRELRAEVAFLRQQLEAAGATVPPLLPGMAAAGVHGSAAASQLVAPKKISGGSAAAGAATAATAASASPLPAAAAMDKGGGGAFDSEEEAAYANQLRSSDVEVLVRAVIEASRVAVASSTALTGLRAAYARTSASLESLRVEYDTLALEDARLRDRLSLLETLVTADGRGAAAPSRLVEADGGGSEAFDGLYTASTAALIELEELRRENALLHERLQLLEPNVGPSGVVLSATTRGSMGTIAAQPVTTACWGGGSNTLGVPGRSTPARCGSNVRPATSGTGGVGAGSSARGTGMTRCSGRQQQAQRAQSAGALLPTGASSGSSGAAAVAVAAAALNPFIPNDVLSAVLSPPPQPVGSGNAAGGNRHGNSTRPQTSTSIGSSNTSKTLTVDQLRSVLQYNGGPGKGGSASLGAAAAPTDAGVEGVTRTDSNDVDAGAAAVVRSAAVAFSQRPTTLVDTATSGCSTSTSTTTATGRLAELGHAVASRALTSGVRLSTTGKLLPAAPARMAVEAAATGSASSPMRLGTGSSSTVLMATTGPSKDLPALSGSGMAMATGPPPTGSPSPDVTLVQLLAERNALMRQRLAGGQ